jgi:aminoglycoside 6'-N-acetyltransferase I
MIVDLSTSTPVHIEETARLLFDAFHERTAAWPDVESATAEVLDSLQEGRVSRVALDEGGRVIGWIGGQPQYDGHVWELHPLVVDARHRRRGVGRALVEDLESIARARGGITLWLGSDDELGETSLAGRDLFEGLAGQLDGFRSWGEHPYPFYRRLGFRLVGVMPDANGVGKPDIFMAKRIAQREG